jgi:hypothetical protein
MAAVRERLIEDEQHASRRASEVLGRAMSAVDL